MIRLKLTYDLTVIIIILSLIKQVEPLKSKDMVFESDRL